MIGRCNADRPRATNPRALARRKEHTSRNRIRPGATLDGLHMQRHAPTGTRKREVIAMARQLTGRPTIGWKAAKKYGQRIERKAKQEARFLREAMRAARS